MKNSKKILNLAEANQAGIGNKARQLAKLMDRQPLLFSVPAGLVLLPAFSVDRDMTELRSALQPMGTGPFAVRSCGLDEDGAATSMAGKFQTELHVTTQNIPEAIAKVRASFGTSVETGAVLIQQMVAPDYAGVLFTRSPENSGLASCEYSYGTADKVVSGTVEPERVNYGRWSGKIYSDRNTNKEMLSLVFLVGLIIEEMMGKPQDIEWAWEKQKKKLYILQSRDITSVLYDKDIALEQERLARLLSHTKAGPSGGIVLQDASVREVVSTPSRLTRSLLEKVYSPAGSLGRSFELLGLPSISDAEPFVISAFGQLYENAELKAKLFGFHPRRYWSNYKLKKRVKAHPEELKKWLANKIAVFPPYPAPETDGDLTIHDIASRTLEGVRLFVEEIYPVAYGATLLAQLAGEEESNGSLTGQLMRDLSRLHHAGDMGTFLERWGHRSINDYELSEPRFYEAPESAVSYSLNFKSFPWEEVEHENNFVYLKELAKDQAIKWLVPLRENLLLLEETLGLEKGSVFYLQIKDIEALASGGLSSSEMTLSIDKAEAIEKKLRSVDLGSNVTLSVLEKLQETTQEKDGLKGKMVAHRKSFTGYVRNYTPGKNSLPHPNEIVMAHYLEPELVGSFADSIGCIVDMGGTLSHAAIVARELSYPILVLPGCTSTIKEGDRIEVSTDGRIQVL